jgi:hypothetical protein
VGPPGACELSAPVLDRLPLDDALRGCRRERDGDLDGSVRTGVRVVIGTG